MTPILYASSETDFSTLGLGVLSDAVSCNVRTVLNGIFELEMRYPTTGKRYGDIAISNVIKAESEKNGTPQLFDIYEISKPLNGIITIYASHVSNRKQFIPVMPCSASSVSPALQEIKNNSAEENPFTFWTDKSTVAPFSVKTPKSLGQCLGGSDGSILDVYGGEYEFDNFTIKLWNRRGADNSVSLRYGKNITSIEQEETIASTITGICPYWADDSGNVVVLPERVVQSDRAENYPFKRTVTRDFSQDFENQPTVAQLRTATQSYITSNNIGIPKVGMDVSYENLADYEEYKDIALLEQVRMGDTVHVYFEPLDISATARIVETRYNCLLEKYDRVRIGSVKSSIPSVINTSIEETKKEVAKSNSALERAFESAIEALSGADGGYIVIRQNEVTGQPYEILAMDTNDINTARKVLRLNSEGLGYSQNGINGPYTAAITGTGIVATAITTGVLNAMFIKAGILQSQESESNPKFYLNLDSGVLKGNFSELKISGSAGATQAYADQAEADAISTAAADATSKANTAQSNAISTAAGNTNTAISNYDTSLNQQKVFNKLTNNQANQGIYIQNGQLYINASMIAAGILSGREINNGNGTFKVTEQGDVTAKSGNIGGWNISSTAIYKDVADPNDSSIVYRVYLQPPLASVPDSTWVLSCQKSTNGGQSFGGRFILYSNGEASFGSGTVYIDDDGRITVRNTGNTRRLTAYSGQLDTHLVNSSDTEHATIFGGNFNALYNNVLQVSLGAGRYGGELALYDSSRTDGVLISSLDASVSGSEIAFLSGGSRRLVISPASSGSITIKPIVVSTW